MREKDLRNLAVFCSVLGLVMLFYISGNLELERTDIGDITARDVGGAVEVCGRISTRFVSKSDNIFLDLRDETGRIKVVIFSNTAGNLKRFGIDAYGLTEGDEVCVAGNIDDYEGEIEIICKKLRYE